MFILTKIEAQFFWNQRSLILVFSHSYPRFPCCQPRVFVALVGSCGFPTNIPSVNPTVKSDFFRFAGRPRLDYSNPKDSGQSENLGGNKSKSSPVNHYSPYEFIAKNWGYSLFSDTSHQQNPNFLRSFGDIHPTTGSHPVKSRSLRLPPCWHDTKLRAGR